MRREINILLGAPISYMFFSKVLRSHYQVKEVVAAYVLGSAAIALIALAESGLGWLFYVELTRHWGLTEGVSYAIRAGRLRAVVSTGHFLSLGFSLALAFGCWLYLKRSVPSRLTVIMVGLLMWAGMMASYARGAWIAAILMLFLYYWLQPGGLGKVFKAFAACVVAGMVALATPWGDQLTSSLPFLGGTVDNFNIEYRQRLFQRALELIPDHPWFGDTRVIQRMQDMRQGEGIVDLVNSYLNIALQYGLVALGSILLVYVLVLVQTWKTSRALRTKDDDAAALGTVLITGILGGLFFAWGGPFPGQTLMFAAVATAYVRICREQRAAEIKARVPKRRQPAPILPHG